MIRKQIYLEDRQDAQLKRVAGLLKVSEASLIRDSLDRGLRVAGARPTRPEAWQAVKAFLRKRMRHNPLAGKRTWRRDELYDR